MAADDAKDAFWILKLINKLAMGIGQSATYVAIAIGICLAIGGLIGWLAAGKTNDPSKTKGGAVAMIVIGILLTSVTTYMEMGNNTAGGSNSGLQSWEQEWSSDSSGSGTSAGDNL